MNDIAAARPALTICEVGPRDGLQAVAAVMPTAAKLRWIEALAHAGLREIEVASFVPARLLPQMADADAVVRHCAAVLRGVTVVALVPNRQGAAAALAAGARKLTLPVSASLAHSLANVRKTPLAMVEELRAVAALRSGAAGVGLEVGISTAFGWQLAGRGAGRRRDPARRGLPSKPAPMKSACPTLSARRNPAQVRRLFGRLRAELGDKAGAAHLHNTRGLGLANCLAAFDVGVTTFDASLGGLGGCPFAPGAFRQRRDRRTWCSCSRRMGVGTGIDLEALLAAREPLAAGLPDEPLYGMTALAGLPKGLARHA